MALSRRSFKQLLLWLIEGSRGGVNRGKIIEAIKDEPLNANQLCNLLGVDYRTIRHHLEVLEKNHLIVAVGEHYGKVYFLSQNARAPPDLRASSLIHGSAHIDGLGISVK